MIPLSDLQEKIGYQFQNIDLLRQALTHRSYLNENPQKFPNNRHDC